VSRDTRHVRSVGPSRPRPAAPVASLVAPVVAMRLGQVGRADLTGVAPCLRRRPFHAAAGASIRHARRAKRRRSPDCGRPGAPTIEFRPQVERPASQRRPAVHLRTGSTCERAAAGPGRLEAPDGPFLGQPA